MLISATLASTIGLDEAVMLHVLGELVNQARPLSSAEISLCVTLSQEQLKSAFPFWESADISRIQKNLNALGLITFEYKKNESGEVIFTLADDRSSNANSESKKGRPEHDLQESQKKFVSKNQDDKTLRAVNREAARAQNFLANGGKTLIPADWRPDSSWIAQCKQHNISDDFIEQLLPNFVSYWLDRGQTHFSWGNVFLKYAIREWRAHQNRHGIAEHGADMSSDWCPSEDAMSILLNADINIRFIEDAVPEFILFWQERGAQKGAWNSKFIEHVRRQWARYSASLGFDDTPRPISKNWQPSADFYEILEMAEIDSVFAKSKIAEFVLYWRDSQQAKASWNTVFLQFIKAAWSKRLRDCEDGVSSYAPGFQGSGTNQQNIESRLQSLADRSWAD